MCESQAEGGARCAAHTRPIFESAIEGLGEVVTNPTLYNTMYRDRWELTPEAEKVAEAVREYASTKQGQKAVADYVAGHRKKYGNSNKFAMFLTRERIKGEELAAARKEAKAQIKKAKAKLVGHRGGGAGTGSVEKLKPSVGTTAENNCLAVFPQIGDYWKAEDNNGIGPEQVRPGSNGQLNWRCAECKRLIEKHNFRVNMLTGALKAGRVPVCAACDPRRKERFSTTQQELTALTDVLGDDPDAFNALPPTVQYALMQKMGLLRGSDTSMNRTIGMSIVHGDLTLKDVVLANDVTELDDRIRDHGDDTDDLVDVTNLDINDEETTHTSAKVDQVLAAAAVLSLVDEDSELAATIQRANNEALWESAYKAEANLDEYVEFLDARRGVSPQADAALDRFQTELAAVRNTPLPDGYQTLRTNTDGKTVTYEPTLAQRRFVALVDEKRRFMNLSGTGAGKTLSTTLAVQATGARETIVVCPKAVINQWDAEFTGGFPHNTEVRLGLPKAGETLPPPPPGVNRVWVTNYDQFQGDATALKERINPLADRLDAIVYDEMHMAKTDDATATSNRRKALQDFTDRAGRANPDLVVIGASATPVVNNLDEAKSLLRLVEGPGSKSFPTKPTMKNAATAYNRLSAAGIRHMPTYDSTLTRNEETVDITANIHRVQGRLNEYRKESKSNRITPAMMERALLPEKLPTIVAKVKANKDADLGPTIVYTEYTTGMVKPMRTRFEQEGLRVATYTGTESDTERKNALEAFQRGEVDVLIGSRPIGTGVDGLQHTSSRMIVASAAWTAAQDDQMVGRLQRRGQNRDVQVDYVLTEAKAGDLRWSWCKDNRMKRIHFKRDIANAAVDGILPDGTFESSQHGAEKALDALKSMTSALARDNYTPAA